MNVWTFAALLAASLGQQMQAAIKPPPPTAGVPRGETPRNVRPWTPPATTPGECSPPLPPPKK